jgi:hypothetical protein
VFPSVKLEAISYRVQERDTGWFVQQRGPARGNHQTDWLDVLGPVTREVAEQEVWLRQRLLELIRNERDRHDVA